MSKRISITLADEHYAALREIAKQNKLSTSMAAYMMMDEWMQIKALQFEIHDAIADQMLDQAANGTPH